LSLGASGSREFEVFARAGVELNIVIERIDWPSATEREISSRSASVNAIAERLRCGGRMPPV
jgi:hypothetical protein